MRNLLLITITAGVFLSGCNLMQNEIEPEDMSEDGIGIEEQTGDEPVYTGSLKDAALSGEPMRCTYEVDGATVESAIKDGQFKGKMEINGTLANVVVKNDCMWSWDEASGQGVTMCVEPESQESVWDNPEYSNPDITYTCFPASVSDEEFALPEEVTFMDMGGMVENIQKSMGDLENMPDIPNMEDFPQVQVLPAVE